MYSCVGVSLSFVAVCPEVCLPLVFTGAESSAINLTAITVVATPARHKTTKYGNSHFEQQQEDFSSDVSLMGSSVGFISRLIQKNYFGNGETEDLLAELQLSQRWSQNEALDSAKSTNSSNLTEPCVGHTFASPDRRTSEQMPFAGTFLS